VSSQVAILGSVIVICLSLLSLLLPTPPSPAVFTVALGLAAAISAFWMEDLSEAGKLALVFMFIVLAGMQLYSESLHKKRDKDEQAEALKAIHVQDKQTSDTRHSEVMTSMKQVYEANLRVLEMLAIAPKGTLESEVLSLSREILAFVLGREGGEPKMEVIIMGAMPMPVGKYREYDKQTGKLYEEKFGERVRKAIADLKKRGLEDPALNATLHATPDAQVARRIAEGLANLASKL
jgi:hypothetical protein